MGTSGIVYCMARQPDGKILSGGEFPFNNAIAKFLMRINEDGTGDETFSSTAINSIVYDIKLQADGKIIVAEIHGVVRLNADGSLDPSFSFQTTNVVRDDTKILLQSNGKIILNLENAIVRLNTDGSLDTGFGIAGYVNTPAVNGNTIALQADDKIIYTNTGLASNIPVIFRLDANGNSDASFNSTAIFYNGEPNPAFYSVLVQPDGKILISGVFSYSNDTNSTTSDGAGIVRLNSDGSTDAAFTGHENGYDNNPGIISGLANVKITGIQPDGKIVITEITLFNSGTVQRFHAKRLNTDGSVDPSLIVNLSTGTNGGIYSSVLLPNGKIIAGGYMDNYNGVATSYIVRLKADGSLDVTNNAGANATVVTQAIQTDGKILIGGEFNTYNGILRPGIARVNTDGSLDETFNALASINGQGTVYAMAIQADGKIIAYNNFSTLDNRLLRLNTDGSVDNTFTASYLVPGTFGIHSIVIQTDGKIIIAGYFPNNKGVYRLNTDGSLDPGFTTGNIGTSSYANDVALQTDGKIIAGGYFNTYNNSVCNNIVRLNTDGSIDNSFITTNNAIPYVSAIKKIIMQADGKILTLSDNFSWDESSERIRRLNTNGTIDNSFSPDFNVTDGDGFRTVTAMALQEDGKIIISADKVYPADILSLSRLNTDGSIDASFLPGSGFSLDYPRVISIQTDGKIIAGGNFTVYDGTQKGRLIRVLAAPCTSLVTPSLSIAASSAGSICAGTAVTFTATPVNGGNEAFYQWRKNGINISFETLNFYSTNTYANGDIITCRLFSTGHCVSPDSAISNSITMSVAAQVTPSVTIAITSGSNPVCSGNQLTFTATPVNGGSNPIYQWTKNSSINIGSNSATLDYSDFTNGDIIRCRITNNDGCTTQASATSFGIIVNTTSPSIWYLDADGDGYYNGSYVIECSSPGPGYTTTVFAEGDCNDNNAAVHQSFTFYIDADHDGYGTFNQANGCAVDANTPPVGYSTNYNDCNDNDPTVWQIGNVYFDADGDGYYGSFQYICYGNTFAPGYSFNTLGADCDDNDNTVWQTVAFYIDQDGDGYTVNPLFGCYGATIPPPPTGYVATSLGFDCNDNDNTLWQGGHFYIDNDEDGYYGDFLQGCFGAALPPHYYHYDGSMELDCNDNDNSILNGTLFYADADGDGYGTINNSMYFCDDNHAGYVADNTDCNDNDNTIHPGAIDICNNGIDEDCSGTADDQPITYYADTDGDGYGDPLTSTQTCDAAPSGYVTNSSDCDDTNGSIHPGAEEIEANGFDDNCDGLIDTRKLFRDNDFDGFGDITISRTDNFSPGYYYDFNDGLYHNYVLDSIDCDDNNYYTHPGAQEICDGLDNDCNDIVDDNVASQFVYRDVDADGYTAFLDPAVVVCTGGSYIIPAGYVVFNGFVDCDDNNAAIYPGATENLTNGIDDDCDGLIDVIPNNCEWNGSLSSNWHDPANWDCNQVPGFNTIANIPEQPNQPVLSADAQAFRILIPFGSNTMIDLNNHALTVNGLLQYGATIKGSPASSLIFKNSGSGYVTMDQSADGVSNALSSLTFNTNSDNNYIQLQNKLVIIDSVVPTRGTLTTADELYLKSTAAKTASILRGRDAGNYIQGQATIERYIPNNNFRSWRLLSVPTYGSGQTIRQAWQEGDANPNPLDRIIFPTTEHR